MKRRRFLCSANELVKLFDRRWKAGSVRWISNSEIAISPRYVPLDRYADGTGELVVVNLEGKIKPVYSTKTRAAQEKTNAWQRSHVGSVVGRARLDKDSDSRRALSAGFADIFG